MMGKAPAAKPKQQSNVEIDKSTMEDANKSKKVKQIYQRKLVQSLHVIDQSSKNTSHIDINAEEQVRRNDAHNKNINGSSQHGRKPVLADRNDAATTICDQPENQGISNSNLSLHGLLVKIL
ncbi:hypothetical protein ACH5RR_003222 [Cinchona calisaya]|uniref:Uncharacterized protein n=1 Tax=Cinchona calisaya TaxID=153742 RepID=A0ABD3AU85_9GENT